MAQAIGFERLVCLLSEVFGLTLSQGAVANILARVVSMAEATSQAVAVSEVVGRLVDRQRDVPRTILGDALMSLVGGCFGTSLITTSGENIGIVRATGVRSRYVTAACGAMLAPVVVFAIICRMGIDILRRADLHAPEMTPSWDLGWELVRPANRDQVVATVMVGRLRLWRGWPPDWEARADVAGRGAGRPGGRAGADPAHPPGVGLAP